METTGTYSAFFGVRLALSAGLPALLLRVKTDLDQGELEPLLIFDDLTGTQIDFDLRGSAEEIVARLASHPCFAAPTSPAPVRMGPGRPRLGVVSREVSLLPRHWQWLEQQRGGMSVALRKLVDEARKHSGGSDVERHAIEAAGKFMWVMAGSLPNFEDASRALFAKDRPSLETLMRGWPGDIAQHVRNLLTGATRPRSVAPAGDLGC